jgi:hypothetical protein
MLGEAHVAQKIIPVREVGRTVFGETRSQPRMTSLQLSIRRYHTRHWLLLTQSWICTTSSRLLHNGFGQLADWVAVR